MRDQTSSTASTFEFDAFICYRTSKIPDSSVGEELQKLLESYPVPRPLSRNIVRPKIFRSRLKVFRDTTDLSAGEKLDEAIRGRLRVSRWMNVVCSPDTPRSSHCNDEVCYFRKGHGDDRVLFLLIAGEPHELFPLSATGRSQASTSEGGDANGQRARAFARATESRERPLGSIHEHCTNAARKWRVEGFINLVVALSGDGLVAVACGEADVVSFWDLEKKGSSIEINGVRSRASRIVR
jgi:hypothetical protein